MNILKYFIRKLNLPLRLEIVASWYLISLILEQGKFTLRKASTWSGLATSQFSRLLSGHRELALDQLNRYSRRMIEKGLRRKASLVADSHWKVAVIIDATLHERSTRHVENSQKFNHGQGWVIGHQWTNIVLYVGGVLVPLPPIPFQTKKYCRENGITYKTEPYKIITYLKSTPILQWLAGIAPEDVVFLMDSGYDNKKLQRFINSQGHEFVGSLKKTRSVKTETQGWCQIVDLFNRARKNAPWKTVRVKMDSGKQRRYRIRELSGYLKGLLAPAKLICSEKPKGGKLYLACSNEKICGRTIVMAYRLRWKVEVFHHDVKSLLSFEDLGAHKFESIESHVYWVYLAYLLIEEEKFEDQNRSKTTQQVKEDFIHRHKIEDLNKLHYLAARFDKGISIKKELDERVKYAMAA
jgi:hypothetical protein